MGRAPGTGRKFARTLIVGLFAVGIACASGKKKAPVPYDARPVEDPFLIASTTPDQHRGTATPCTSDRPSFVPDGGFPDGTTGPCMTDSDCTEGKDGRCILPPGTIVTVCTYDECTTDQDCSDGGVCACGDYTGYQFNACVSADCRVDSDCGDGGFCSPVVGGCPPLVGTVGYDCHTPQDQCVNTSDCTNVVPGLYCVYDSVVGKHWFCAPIDCSG